MHLFHFASVRRAQRSAGVLALLTAVAAPASAQGAGTERFLVSTTSDAGVLGPLSPDLSDTDLVVVGGGAVPAAWLTERHWAALADFAPRDVDAVDTMFGVPRAGDLYLSFLSDDGGFLDGDVVRLSASGAFEVAFDEASIATALGDPGLAIDLDGFAFESPSPSAPGPFGGGRLLFSLSSDATTPVLGPVSNGDVLALDEQGTVSVLFTEADVQDALTAATGSTDAVGDVHAVEWVAGEVWVAIQSPSAHDGAVLALGPNARVVASESEMALGGDEIDALTRVVDEEPLCVWTDATLGGANGRGVVQNATPNGPVVVLGGGTSGWLPLPQMAGFGGLAIDAGDPLLAALLSGPVAPVYWADGSGTIALPAIFASNGAGTGPGDAAGVTLQAIDVASLRVSAPFRVLP